MNTVDAIKARFEKEYSGKDVTVLSFSHENRTLLVLVRPPVDPSQLDQWRTWMVEKKGANDAVPNGHSVFGRVLVDEANKIQLQSYGFDKERLTRMLSEFGTRMNRHQRRAQGKRGR